MQKVEEVFDGKRLVAIIFRNGFGDDGVNFISQPDFPLQVGVHKVPFGRETQFHSHEPVGKNIVIDKYEVLFVLKGILKIFFHKKDNQVVSKILKKGDGVLVMNISHKVKFAKNTEVLEIKQGPYKAK